MNSFIFAVQNIIIDYIALSKRRKYSAILSNKGKKSKYSGVMSGKCLIITECSEIVRIKLTQQAKQVQAF